MPRKCCKLWCQKKKARCVVYVVMVYFLFCLVFINGGYKIFYNSQVTIWRCFRRNFEFVKNVTAKGTHDVEANLQSDRFMANNFENAKDLDEMKPQNKGIIIKVALSEKRQLKEDNLLPLREMFAKAGEEAKRREKALNSVNLTSTGVPLTDLSVIGDTLKSRVLLLVVVSSAAARRERRNAIRQTWWKKCSTKMVCFCILYYSI